MIGVGKQLDQILDEYGEQLSDAVEKVTNEIATETVKELRSNSPKAPGGGAYARSWRQKKAGKGRIVYNAKHYRLTHLLENGHIIANQYGSTNGRVEAKPHIKPVEEKMSEKYVKEITKEISR